MLVLWRTPFVPDRDFDRYAHCWHKMGGKVGEPVIARELSSHNLDVAWDNVMRTPGRMVAWILPHFLPHPTFFSELDYLLAEKYHIVTLRNYDAVFQPGQDRPCKWEPDGTVSSGLVVFQLNGQRRLKLPSSRTVRDYWEWLAKKNSQSILRLDQHYATGPMVCSTLGTLLPDCWAGSDGVFGRFATGDAKWYSKQELRRNYLSRLEAWELWTEKQ